MRSLLGRFFEDNMSLGSLKYHPLSLGENVGLILAASINVLSGQKDHAFYKVFSLHRLAPITKPGAWRSGISDLQLPDKERGCFFASTANIVAVSLMAVPDLKR